VHALAISNSCPLLRISTPDLEFTCFSHHTKDREWALNEFITNMTIGAKILLSPSMERGINLPDDLCRFIIIPKTPFPGLGDKLTKARTYTRNSRWYASQTAQILEQMCGRGMRHEQDHCKIYCLDSSTEEFILNNGDLFSEHFKSCITF